MQVSKLHFFMQFKKLLNNYQVYAKDPSAGSVARIWVNFLFQPCFTMIGSICQPAQTRNFQVKKINIF
jgi:hypothetical protein